MTAIFPLLLLLVFAAIVGFSFAEGLWSNAVRLINVVTAGLLAMNFWEPLARWVQGWGDWFASMTFFLDFLCLWLLFVVCMVIFRTLTNRVSAVKVRFLTIADRIGGVVLAMAVGWVFMCFTTATLHTAPLGVTAFGGGFDPEKKMMFGLAPDRQWLIFCRYVSAGSFSRTQSEAELQSRAYGTPDSTEPQSLQQVALFDRELPFGDGPVAVRFIGRYAMRRLAFQTMAESTGSARASSDQGPRR